MNLKVHLKQQSMRYKNILDDSYELCSLDTKYVVPEDVVSGTLPNLQERGGRQLYKFMKARLWNRPKAISDAVTKN